MELTNITNNEKINYCSTKRFYIESNKQTNNKNIFTSTIYKHKLLSKTSNTNNASAIFYNTFSKS